MRVATVHSIGLYELSASLKRYLKAFPQVQLHLEYSRSSKIYEDAVRGHIDLGVVAFPGRRPGITVIPFRQDRLVLVVPPGHALARHRSVAVRKLSGEPLVGFERDIPTRKETDRFLRRHGAEVRYVMELDNVETIKRVVEIGQAIAILPEARGAARGEAEGAGRGPAGGRDAAPAARDHPSPGQAFLSGGREVHRVSPDGMTSLRAAAALLLLTTVAGCGGARTHVLKGEEASPSGCVRLQGEREVRGQTLCEDVFSCFRPPGGVVDRIGLRRLAPCGGATGPVVLYLPGMHMNGEISSTSANQDLRLYLAQAGHPHLEPRLPDARGAGERVAGRPADPRPAGRATASSRTSSGRPRSSAAPIPGRSTWLGSASAPAWRTTSRRATTSPSWAS